jgi:protein AroM
MKKKIGAITIGQSPRADVTCDIIPIFGDEVELVEAGALDGLSREEIAGFIPEEGDYVLVTRLRDGSSVTFAERYIIPRLQQCVTDLEKQGAELVIFLCTGEFPDFEAGIPLVYPNEILMGCVPALTSSSRIAVICPSEKQTQQSISKWGAAVKEVIPIPASPYSGSMDDIKAAADKAKDLDVDLIVLDCIGYTSEMKGIFTDVTGKNTVLSRTLAARVVSEIIDKGK